MTVRHRGRAFHSWSQEEKLCERELQIREVKEANDTSAFTVFLMPECSTVSQSSLKSVLPPMEIYHSLILILFLHYSVVIFIFVSVSNAFDLALLIIMYHISPKEVKSLKNLSSFC